MISEHQSKIGQMLFGFEETEQQILKNFQNHKLHHALLISGPKGIGKASFATKLAAKIISPNQSSENFSNGFCLNKINSYNNPNLLIIRRELGSKQELKRDISVDNIRKIFDFTNLTSSSSQYRIIIIDAADEMNRNSANALLKILEEPPSNVFLFLICHNSNLLPITIRSRCNLIKINPLNFDNFKKALIQIEPEILSSQIHKLFILASGSVHLALEFHKANALKLYEEILSVNPAKPGFSGLIDKITHKDFSFTIFEQIIIFYLNRLTKALSGTTIDEYIFDHELQNLISNSNNNLDKIFAVSEKITKLLSDTKNLNLDKKQSAINIFNLIYG